MNGQRKMIGLSDMSSKDHRHLLLIVEDDFVNREMLKAYLMQDYDLICAETGDEALEKIQEYSETLSLILLDLNLPGIKGLEIMRIVKQDIDLSRIPIIVLTSDTESEVESLNAGASDFIPKPYPRYEIIHARIRRSIELSMNRDLIRGTARDQLTGLYNREYFYLYAEQYDKYHPEEPTDALVVDISHFHVINQRFGKEYGDEILRRIGAELYDIVHEKGGLACRREADTFQVYCPHMTQYEAFAERVTAACREAAGRIRIRVGVCPEVDKTLEMERRFDHAKSAADTIRNSYSESVAFYDKKLQEQEVFAEKLLEDFGNALVRKQFLVYFQPKYDIQAEIPALCGAEALVRWKHPELGMISPGLFIPLFESNGLIRDLDNYVWREAASMVSRWKQEQGTVVPVSVNVSRIDMLDPELPETLGRIVKEFGIDFCDLHLEITESAYTQDSEHIIRMVSEMRDMGFRIEMDDFGSGYSSLNMITRLPIDVLKLDMMFIRTAFGENGNTGLLKLAMDVASFLSVPMVAEGVENKEQMLTLKDLGCSMAQGYYFARPMPAEEFEVFLRGEE